MLTAAGSPLVAGSIPATNMQTSTIEVQLVRAIWLAGKQHKVGEKLTVSKALAAEIIGSSKAVLVAAVETPKEPDTTAGGKKK